MAEREALGASVRELRPKAGLPSLRAYTDSTLYPKYAEIINSLRNSKVTIDEHLSERELARFITRLMQFMESNLGRDANPKNRPMLTKFPIHIFSDLEPEGALYHVLHTCYEFADEKKWDGIDFKDDARRGVNMEMLMKVSKVLKRRALLPSVKVFFAPSITAEESDELQRILQIHGGVVVSSLEVASHIIYADTEGTREHETDAQVMIRYLKLDAERARVHWWYHPDSYDDWVPEDQVFGKIDDTEQKGEGPWHVTARWIRDLDLFNEWMNEMDYELNSKIPRLLSTPSNEANGVANIDKSEEKSKTRAHPDSPVSEPAAKRPKLRSQSVESDADSEKRTRGSRDEEEILSEGNIEDLIVPNGDSNLVQEEEATKVVKPTYSVPSFSSWFDVTKINEIERNACPEFFSGKFESKTPEIYKEIRNYFVNSWRAKPKRYITVSSSRGKVIGDWPAVLRVHSFLEHWGLINHNVAADTLPLPILSSPPASVAAFNSARGSNKAPFVFDDGSVAFINNSRVMGSTLSGSPKKRPRNNRRLLFDKPGDSDSDSDEENDGSPRRNTVDYHCDICSQDCSTLRFHCATQSDMDLCETCYTEKKYDTSKMQPRDFIQMKSAGGGIGSQEVDDKIWTESETLLLLEALEMYEDNWELVAEHVGSKNKDQCVMQFVRLPIEDRFLDNPPGNCSDPAKPTDMAPVGMLKKAGAKKEALARVSSKTALPVPYSGRPSICGADERNNAVVSHALNLSTLTTTKLMAKPHMIMLEAVREDGFRGNLNDLTPTSPEAPDGDVVMSDGPPSKDSSSKLPAAKDISRNSTKLSITTQESYKEKLRSVPSATETAEGELGQFAAETLIELLEKKPELLNSLGIDEDETLPNKRVAASVALAAAASRAYQMERLERAELDRLITMALEIKLDIIRMKIDHFKSFEEHEARATKLISDEHHNRFAREMRAHHRLTIRDPAAVPALNGPIGCDTAKDSAAKEARKNPAPFDLSEQTSFIKPSAIRTVSKPQSMPHISPAQYFAMQLEEAERERKKAEQAREEAKRQELARQEKLRQEQARQLQERIAQANAARIRAQQLQQVEQARQAQQRQQQRAAHLGSAPYMNGIINHQLPNGAGAPSAVGTVQYSPPMMNGLQRSQMNAAQNIALQRAQYSTQPRISSSAPVTPQRTQPNPTPSAEASENPGNVSKGEESTGPKTPVLPARATRTKSRRRSRKSGEKAKTKSKRRTDSAPAEEEDRIIPVRSKSRKRSESTPVEREVVQEKAATVEPKKTRSSRSRSNNKPSDTTLKLRVRRKDDSGRIKKGRTTRTSLRSTRNSVAPIKLRLPIRRRAPLPLRLRIRPARGNETGNNEDENMEEGNDVDVSMTENVENSTPNEENNDNRANGAQGEGVDNMDLSGNGVEGDENKMGGRIHERENKNISIDNEVYADGKETEDEE